MTTQNAINWPERYLPGTGDNFVSNEVIVQGLTAAQIWRYLTDTSTWESYYDNITAVSFPEGGGPVLKDDVIFTFEPVGFASVRTQHARVVEFQAPAEGVPGRLSWTAAQDGTPEERLDVLHAWLVEDLPGGRVRILTQETQIGHPAAELARRLPNPMLNGHQAWLNGLVEAASGGPERYGR
ncbi:SRPBCC domain-containing protein [Streptomyces sp. BG9H]|uniref:SRPBCC domain-containing protein n=1 Tax=Streptomyces anatolicus TaxID=2675858 RepID=A0ABS6YTX2_9ACTN|nr:SRPBCC family protein [Streptomyces anatolicus]MBW5424449.1 SRPBCC domain-containing protein [Streptomyces anatolicus]